MSGAEILLGFATLVLAASPVGAITDGATNASPPEILLTNPLGDAVGSSISVAPPEFLPTAETCLNSQLPTPVPGEQAPQPTQQHREELREETEDTIRFFPPYQPRLMPYLATQDQLSDNAFKPGLLLPSSRFDVEVQRAKHWVADVGLRYSLQQTFTWVSMTDVMQGDNTIGFYTLSFQAKWAVYDDPASGTAGWISTKIAAKTGLGTAGKSQSAASNLGSITDPTGIWSSVNGFRIPELAWQQSFQNGEVVAVAGMVNQSDYFDANKYANNGRGQFLNSALINSMVVPLPAYNFGLNVQWQPVEEWYGMIGGSVGNAKAGVAPWTDFSWNDWTLLFEVGYAPRDFLGLGPGVYRIQPFVDGTDGSGRKAGLGLNLQQQLGAHSPFGWYGRFGLGGSENLQSETSLPDTGSQIATGFVMKGPCEYLGLFANRRHDAAGIGIIWSRPSSEAQPLYHKDEFALEIGYVLQFTPTMKLQPDLQVVWNPAHNPDSGPATVFQLQLDLAW